MTDIDTAAIRAALIAGRAYRPHVLALCDALDAAHAERDGAVLCGTELIEQCRIWRDRAEVAEAGRDGWRELSVTHEADAHRAEARIAAFLDDGLASILYPHDGEPLHVGRAREIYVACREALTGETE